VNFRYVVGPSSKLPEGKWQNPLSFNSTQMEEMFAMGQQDAKNVVAMGATTHAKYLTE